MNDPDRILEHPSAHGGLQFGHLYEPKIDSKRDVLGCQSVGSMWESMEGLTQ